MKRITKALAASALVAFSFAPILAASTEYVRDDYGLISMNEAAELNDTAEDITDEYNVGVYIRVEPDNGGYSSIQSYGEALFKEEDLKDPMVMLLITMKDREYDIIAHGDDANIAFTDYGKNQIAENFLPYLSDGDYEEAFSTFLDDCRYYLKESKYNEPIDTWIPEPQPQPEYDPATALGTKLAGSFGGGSILSLIICFFIKGKNKTASIASSAEHYVAKNGIDITHCQDIYLYSTQTVTRINNDDNHGGHAGGTSINSGGFSHSSGHF